MTENNPPFRFDLRSLLTDAGKRFRQRVGSMTIKLPFVSISVCPHDLERSAAREIVIRTADRRVLNAFECCDGCVDKALASLQEIRQHLVDKKVALAEHADGSLYMIIELMLGAIRQFLTFEEGLSQRGEGRRDWGLHRERYFPALELLRAHLHRCLSQVAKIGGMDIPGIAQRMRYDDEWQLDAYLRPRLDVSVK